MKLEGITFYQVKNSLEELDIKHDFNNDVRSLEGGLWGVGLVRENVGDACRK